MVSDVMSHAVSGQAPAGTICFRYEMSIYYTFYITLLILFLNSCQIADCIALPLEAEVDLG